MNQIFAKNIKMAQFDPEKAKRVRNDGQGDCLFHSVASALRTMPEISRKHCDVSLLRYIVARHITKDQYMMLKAIWDGAVNERDSDLMREYSFMRLGQYSLDDLREVIQTSRYWGDEMALTILEKYLKIRMHVVVYKEGDFKVYNRLDTIKVTPMTKQIILLQISDDLAPHYQLIIYDGKAVFTEADKPDFLSGL